MRVAKWRADEVFGEYRSRAEANANDIMDDVVVAAKNKLASAISAYEPSPNSPPRPIIRRGRESYAKVSFTPKTGKNKGKLVEFETSRRWTGRHYTSEDTLIDTIRRVNGRKNPGNVRVYAGNFKAYWAFMVERGTHKTPAHNFLRPSFHAQKATMLKRLTKGGV